MRLNQSILPLAVAAVLCLSGRSEAATKADTLLLRVQFAGTTALMANTNAAYLTNFSALPETAALGTQIVAKVSGLPARWLGGADRNRDETLLRPFFAELLARGFALELHGTKDGVTDFALAARADMEAAKRWTEAWNGAGKDAALNGKVKTLTAGGWFAVTGNKSGKPSDPSAIVSRAAMDPSAVAQGELSAVLLPGPIQRSAYGAFDTFKLSVSMADQAFRTRATATYAKDLPQLGPPADVPTNLVTDNAISFTVVRNPGSWLEPESPLRSFLPNPIPDVAFFWGGEISPYQMFMALPFEGKDAFNTSFGPTLRDRLKPVAKFIDSGEVVHDTNKTSVVMRTVPFVVPKATVQSSGTNQYLVTELFPSGDIPTFGLTPTLIGRASNRTNLVLFDWEYTKLRFDTWHAVGQLALFVANKEQLGGSTASLKWIRAAQEKLPNGGNSSTEITQTGARELTLSRRGILPFTSLEIFWIANWLESSKFPAANFIEPAKQ